MASTEESHSSRVDRPLSVFLAKVERVESGLFCGDCDENCRTQVTGLPTMPPVCALQAFTARTPFRSSICREIVVRRREEAGRGRRGRASSAGACVEWSEWQDQQRATLSYTYLPIPLYLPLEAHRRLVGVPCRQSHGRLGIHCGHRCSNAGGNEQFGGRVGQRRAV